MARGGRSTQFKTQIDQLVGRAFVEIARTSGVAQGSGSELNVSFRALRAKAVPVRLLAITANPAPSGGGAEVCLHQINGFASRLTAYMTAHCVLVVFNHCLPGYSNPSVSARTSL